MPGSPNTSSAKSYAETASSKNARPSSPPVRLQRFLSAIAYSAAFMGIDKTGVAATTAVLYLLLAIDELTESGKH